VSNDKELLKIGIVLPATKWMTIKRERLTTISNSLQDIEIVRKLILRFYNVRNIKGLYRQAEL